MPSKKRKAPPGGQIPIEQRIIVTSLHRYLRASARAAGKGRARGAYQRFAKRCGTSVQYLTQLALGIRRATPYSAIRIEQASYGIVRAEELCPDFDWHYVKLRDAPRPARRDPATEMSGVPDSTQLVT